MQWPFVATPWNKTFGDYFTRQHYVPRSQDAAAVENLRNVINLSRAKAAKKQ